MCFLTISSCEIASDSSKGNCPSAHSQLYSPGTTPKPWKKGGCTFTGPLGQFS